MRKTNVLTPLEGLRDINSSISKHSYPGNVDGEFHDSQEIVMQAFKTIRYMIQVASYDKQHT